MQACFHLRNADREACFYRGSWSLVRQQRNSPDAEGGLVTAAWTSVASPRPSRSTQSSNAREPIGDSPVDAREGSNGSGLDDEPTTIPRTFSLITEGSLCLADAIAPGDDTEHDF